MTGSVILPHKSGEHWPGLALRLWGISFVWRERRNEKPNGTRMEKSEAGRREVGGMMMKGWMDVKPSLE